MALSNADFRSLLNEADISILSAASAPRKKKGPSVPHAEADAQKSDKSQKRRERYLEILRRKQRHKEGRAPANYPEDGEDRREGEGALARYKDRAKERRKGKDELYQQVAEELQEMKERSIEESKYLGGDVEHTHLVKGLDFALLSKVRSELEKEALKKEQSQQEEASEKKTAQKKMKILSPLARRLFDVQFACLHPQQARFADHVKRLEMALVSGQRLRIANAMFQPGRLAYNFEVKSERQKQSVDGPPTFIFRGEDDPSVQKARKRDANKESSMAAVLLPKITRELREALEWHRENRKKKKQERVARRPGSLKAVREVEGRQAAGEPAPQPPIADDDDIFGGVGGFDAQEALEKATAEKRTEEATAAASPQEALPRLDIIREEEGMEVEEDETDVVQLGSAKRSDLQRQQEQEWGAHSVLFATMKKHQRRMVLTTTEEQDKGFHSVFRRDEQTMLQQRLQVLHDDREKDPAFVSDTYAECYPGFGSEVAYLGYDSDEEGEAKDTARVDTGEYRVIPKGKNQQFKSKEEYEKYIGEIEFVPKAALQYGRRMAGEFAPGGKKKRKMNIDQEWKKIEGMLKEKKAKAG
ncbi:RED family protein [Toxoplasma gondii ME49]|uniref:RED family protein n=16 Tax=Toxoplasma gondii TaxID=5811 RepID=B6KHE7_TOXGV|nr:RED family protein [Toxoplasma gondii ME49]EPT25089.1 RED family protein [Toxoplasma gondii ME49]ESS34426.1 RED family protein [Toxoplasma gondii VEG]KYF49973.1 RED family protein N-terminal region protein [Toxoplasma gondii ARI]CEL78547.1 TPA: RED family protein N-terminal region protein [Toxoplasma gondii VEG]|eukprot:XP_002367270.1 RED family protein [Toxoplasma gondii ME49]